MAIGRITGPMLFSNLDRQGVNLAIDANLVYADVTARHVGISTSSPQYTLDVNGNAHLGNLYILNDTITSDTGKINLGNATNLKIAGGNIYDIMYTDGSGDVSFASMTTLASLSGFTGNNISVGTTPKGTDGYGTNALTTGMNIADAINTLDNILGNITNISGNVITTGNLYLHGVSGYNTTNGILISNGTGATSFVDANTIPAIVSINANTNNINNNLTAFETWANLTFVTATTETALASNVGAYQIYANANIGTLYLGNISTNANLGAYQIYANANAATQATSINSINANIGAFETYANLYIGAAAYGNANVATYLPNYTGNLFPGNVTSAFHGNVYTDYISGNIGNVISFASSGAIGLPVGTTSNRPIGSSGYVRFNLDTPALEYFDGTVWVPVTNTITDQQIAPDGTNNTYTLTQQATAIGVIVSINGVVQQPNLAYTITNNQITFNEVPYVTDLIDIRFLGASVTINNTLSDNLIVSGNITLSGILQSPLTTKTSTSAGTAGQVCYDANYIYICTSTNNWKRVALTGGVF